MSGSEPLRAFRVYVVECHACGKKRRWRSYGGGAPDICNACLSSDVTSIRVCSECGTTDYAYPCLKSEDGFHA